MRASEQYLVLEFSFNQNQECCGWERRSHTSFLVLQPWVTRNYHINFLSVCTWSSRRFAQSPTATNGLQL